MVDTTTKRGYPKPQPGNQLQDDVLTLRAMIDAVDGDMHAALTGAQSASNAAATAQGTAATALGGLASKADASALVGKVDTSLTLAANTKLSDVVRPGFYRMATGHPDAPPGTDNGQLVVMGAAQIIINNAGAMYYCSGGVWQRALGDKSLLEATVGGAITTGSYLLDPAQGTVHHKGLQASAVINMPPPRTGGDQCVLLLYQQGGHAYTLGANISAPIDRPLPALPAGQMLMLTFFSKYEGSGHWYCAIGDRWPG